MLIVDFDDAYDENIRLDLLNKLHETNPKFKCTIFAIPARCTNEFLESLPEWIEIAVHGWSHPTPTECQNWTYERMNKLLDEPVLKYFKKIFKAPGWQISDGCYQALLERDYIVADQQYNTDRRPEGLKVYELGENSWHGHIQNVCGNGIEETFNTLVERIKGETDFRFVSEL